MFRMLNCTCYCNCFILSLCSGYHTIALTRETRSVYTWGHNRVGQLGFPISDHSAGHEDGYFVPKPILVSSVSHLTVAKVVAGWGHSALLTDGGAIYTCGRNFQGYVRHARLYVLKRSSFLVLCRNRLLFLSQL
jgi:alpha-tubulin suppressor-like RCC1 family protein